MGSASREALAQARTALSASVSGATGAELLGAAEQLAAYPALAAVLGDPSAEASAKTQVVDRLFSGVSADARAVLTAAAQGRWSNVAEFVAGVEELGLRAESQANDDLADELLAIADLVDQHHDLQLTLGSKLTPGAEKTELLTQLLSGKVSASAVAVAGHLAASASGRRVDVALRDAARIAADQRGAELATVTVATKLSEAQTARLSRLLEQTAGRPVKVTTVVDPQVLGGIRIEIADDVIDGSVRARLDDLRQRLAA